MVPFLKKQHMLQSKKDKNRRASEKYRERIYFEIKQDEEKENVQTAIKTFKGMT